jgi:hypothetical protein
MTTSIGVDDALNFILRTLRAEGPARFDRDGFDFWASDYAARYLEEVLGVRPRPPLEDQRTYHASVPSFDAAWELARCPLPRPVVPVSRSELAYLEWPNGWRSSRV